jgi:hypothetical protein
MGSSLAVSAEREVRIFSHTSGNDAGGMVTVILSIRSEPLRVRRTTRDVLEHLVDGCRGVYTGDDGLLSETHRSAIFRASCGDIVAGNQLVRDGSFITRIQNGGGIRGGGPVFRRWPNDAKVLGAHARVKGLTECIRHDCDPMILELDSDDTIFTPRDGRVERYRVVST